MTTKKPEYLVYHVTERDDAESKSFWTRIGAAWQHEDGNGFNVELNLYPANGGRIVIRTAAEAEALRSK